MKELLCVCLGSFVGGGLRHLVAKWLPLVVPAAAFPYATLVVNVVGCFLIGVFTTLFGSGSLSPAARALLVTGFCGGLTTFSTFMNENVLMARDGSLLAAAAYTVVSLILGMAALVLGCHVAR